ncbi:MAG: UPF0182 family membrane protein [Thermoleophilia bacterium]
MNQPPNEPFSRLWEQLARRLGLDSDQSPPAGQGPDNVRPLRQSRGRGHWWTGAIAGALFFLIFIVLPAIVYLYTEWLWFGEVGFGSVFTTILLTKIWLGLATGAFFFAVVYANIMIARKMAPGYQFGPGTEVIERMPIPNNIVRWLIPLGLLIPSIIAALAGAAGWEDFLKFVNRTDFGVADPVFNLDTGFYVFTLPLLQLLQSLVWWTLIFSLLAAAAMHFFDYAININEGKLSLSPHVKGHLSVIMGLIMMTLGASYLLKGYVLMFSPRGVVFGASYTDVHAQLPVLKFMAATAVVAGIMFLVNIHFRGWKLPAAAIIIIIATGFFGGQVYPFIVQQYQVSPNELATEEPYIQHNIDFTRRAFDLNGIKDSPFTAADTLTAAQIQNNVNTISNVRLWDPRTLSDTYKQIQTIRPYYTFQDVDVDRYWFDGRLQQVMLSPREISVDGLDSRARTWQNEHLVYTHGYGVVMSPVAQISGEGLPQLIVKDIPPQSAFPELAVTQPAVYYGEKSNDYVIVRSDIQEFDYPKGDDNVYSTYDGSGGVPISNYLKRVAFSARFGSLKLLLSSAVNSDSRIMIHREIRDRVATIAPFLQLDNDPYSVLVDGRLFWIQDAYTTTANYPYSQPSAEGINYMRNSVKVVVDAFNGTVTFYVVDDTDPIIQTYGKIFPDLLTPGDQMPASLRAHLRYPEDLFKTQASMYTTYHMTDPKVFYNKEDQWNLPRQQAGTSTAPLDPYYVIMSLPGETSEEFMLMLPFTPGSRDNMIAWMAAKSDPGSYGQRLVFRFPKDKLVFGPTQIQSRFNQDPVISSQITLWSQSGSQVIFGNLLVIPIDQSILYVQPLYLRAERSQIPELKRVLVSYGGKVSMEADLATALEKIFNTQIAGAPQKAAGPNTGTTTPAGGTTSAPATTLSLKDLAAAASDHYNKAVNAQKNGDWTTYGNELKALQDILTQMQTAGG